MLLKLLEEVIEVRTARPRSLPHGHTLRVHHELEEVIEVRTARPRSLPHGHTLRVHHDVAPAVRHHQHGQKARLSAGEIEIM
jgi:hypothetical protein